MLTYEYKCEGRDQQYRAIDEAIRVVQFIRNKCLRKWMDERGVWKNDLQRYCAVLAAEYSFAARLNSQARQASADRAWFAISRFYDNCKTHKPGKKGYPHFQHDNRSIEYKTTGWKLCEDGKHIIFTDGCGIGRLKLVGNKKQAIATFPVNQIKRVRIVRRADGYYVQFCVKTERKIEHVPTGNKTGIDVGLLAYSTSSDGNTVENPRYMRLAEKKLKQLQRHLSHKKKGSKNRTKARKKLAKAHLKVQRQREDFARKQANALVSSHDLQTGAVATWLTGAWGAGIIEQNAPQTSGKWRVASLPQWQAGQAIDGNWGGSTTVVFKSTKHPKEATEFAQWISANEQSAVLEFQNGAYPALLSALSSSTVNSPVPFFGNQVINEVFKQSATQVDVNFQWGPTMDQVYNDLSDNFANAINGHGTLADALNTVQQSTVTFMKKQGFNVGS